MASIIVAQNYQFGERNGSGQEPLVMKTIKAGNVVAFSLTHPQANLDLPDYASNPNATESKTGAIMSIDADKRVVFYHNTAVDMKNANSVQYKPESIVTDAYKEYSITEVKLANNSVSTRALIDDCITNEKMADNSVTTDNIANASVTTEKIANNAVTSVTIGTGAVIEAKLASGAVTTGKIKDKAVTSAKLYDKAVGTSALGEGAVTSAKLADSIEFKKSPTVVGDVITDSVTISGTYNDSTKRMLANTTWVKNYTLSDNSGLARIASNEIITGTWEFSNDIKGTAVRAKWADLAENYQADADYPVGTLVCFGGEKEITVATSHANAVISEQPALHMNAEMEDGVPIALSGRVRVRVIGKVEKFDKIILSDLSGVGVADNCSCGTCVVGRALESKETEEEGLVLCVVSLNLD